VRAVWSELRAAQNLPFDVVPVTAGYRHGYRYAPPEFISSSHRELGKTVCMQRDDHFLGLDLAAHLLPSYEEQLTAWRAAGARVHLVVYDVLPLRRPEWFSDACARNFRRWHGLVCRQADQVVCISDQVAEDLLQSFSGRRQPEVVRLRLAGDMSGSLPSTGVDAATRALLSNGVTQPTILMVGTIEPRKGYDEALAAFEHLWLKFPDTSPRLVIVGKPGWKTGALQEQMRTHPENGRRLFWLSSASDEALGLMYDRCTAVFLASHAEGFGLPGIEAAMHGRRALVRDLPVFREQQLSNLSFFDDDRPEALGNRLMHFVREAEKPPTPSALPSWRDCVADMLQQMQLQPQKLSATQAAA
jgi:glycosyltransferase involved in cell wall biosynthesis